MLRHALKFARLKILTTCYLIAFLGSVATGSVTVKTFLTILVLMAWYVHASSSNDYADREIDAVNLRGAKDRPLLTGSLSYRNLWTIHAMAGVLALVFSALYGRQAVLLTFIILLLDYAYSFRPIRITDRGALSQLMLPLAYVFFPFSLGYLSSGATSGYPWLLMAGLYTGFVARLLLKDFRDVKGDTKFGKRTFLLRHGRPVTCVVSAVFGLVSLALIEMAIGFSTGTTIALVVGNFIALRLLARLKETNEVKRQLKIIIVLAKIANASVITIIIYYVVKNQAGNGSLWTSRLPLFIGLVMVYRLDTPSFFEHLIWLPLRLFMYICCAGRINGAHNVNRLKGNAIIASNHVTELDPLLIVAALPFFSKQLPLIYVVREKSFYNENWTSWRKFFYGGIFFELIGGFEAFTGLNNYNKALVNHLSAIKDGQSVCIFPVGRRHQIDEFGEARGGTAFLAKKTGLPIIPVHIQGINQKTSLKDYMRRKPRLTITFGEPVYANDIFHKPLNEVTDTDRQAFEAASATLMKKIAQLS